MAHPPLNKDKHPACVQAIDDLLECRENNPYLKLFGACNTQSWALLRCFKEEKEPLRKAHRDAARADKQRLKANFEESRAHVQEVLAKQHARREAEEEQG